MRDPATQRVLITGATGFIGRALARACFGRVEAVGLLSRGAVTPADAGLSQPGVTAYPVDLRDDAATRRAVLDFRPTLVYHLAAVPDAPDAYGQVRDAIDVNLTGTLNLLEAILRAGRCLTVIGDSVKVFGNVPVPYRLNTRAEPDGSYAISKLAAWRLALLYLSSHGLPTVALRPTLVYGPGQGRNVISYAIQQVRDGAPEMRLMGGQQTRDPLHIDDAVSAFLAVASIRRSAYGSALPVSGGQEIAVVDLVRRIVALMDGRTDVQCEAAGMRRTETLRSWCDNRDAAELLGWQPRVSLDQGLRATIAAAGAAPRGLAAPAAALLGASS